MAFLFRLLARLPLSFLHVLGAGIGRLAYALSPTYRRQLDTNLALALSGEAPKSLRCAAAAEAGKTLLELSRIWCRPLDAAAALVVEVSNWECIEAAQQAGRGIIFLTPHLGCFEISAQYFAARGGPITVLYRPPKQRWLQPLIEGGRARGDRVKLAPADMSGVRRLLGALKKGEAVGLLPDQAPGAGEGKWLPYFGRQAYTMTLAARLSETGAAVVFAFAERLPGGRGYRLHLRPPLAPLAGDTLTRAAAINREIEALVRQCPQQYLWGYNRYKRPAGAEPPPEA